jgi:transcriptional regulator with XRE-family HTH domain
MNDVIPYINKTIGTNIRTRRRMLGYSRKQIGELLGVSAQQFGKYERGLDRLNAQRLQQIADLLGVTISYFFQGAQKDGLPPLSSNTLNKANLFSENSTQIMMKNYLSIDKPDTRQALQNLIQSVAKYLKRVH